MNFDFEISSANHISFMSTGHANSVFPDKLLQDMACDPSQYNFHFKLIFFAQKWYLK